MTPASNDYGKSQQVRLLDVLVLGRHIVLKDHQSQQADSQTRAEHLAQFQLD